MSDTHPSDEERAARLAAQRKAWNGRDRYGVLEDDALGAPASSPNQRMDAAAAAVARDRAVWLSRADAPTQPRRAPARMRAVHSL